MKNKSDWHHLYNSRWRKMRLVFLSNNPLCRYCSQVGRVSPATVVDHIVPHKGNIRLFWDEGNWQPLCDGCHNSAKAIKEDRGFAPGCGEDGMPVDPDHPFYKE